MDALLILVAMPLVLPLAILIAALIRLVSPGPVLFQQERVGFLRRRFMCFKFRTMVVNADTADHQSYLNDLMASNVPMVKLDEHGDSRIIRFGVLLRSMGLDELPQLINVLRGEMSLVGPRPCLPYECQNYLPWQWERFNTLPGLTGLWQVNGKNRTTFMEMMRMDVDYARNKSLRRDLVIILKTPLVIMRQVWDACVRRKDKRSATVHASKSRRFVSGTGS